MAGLAKVEGPCREVFVSDEPSLRRAIANALPGDVILIADGVYQLQGFLRFNNKNNVTLRSASNDPAKVILRGRGFASMDRHDDLLRISACTSIRITAITFEECHAYGIKVEAEAFPRDIHIAHCRFFNIGTRHLKGSTSPEGRAVTGSVRHCEFENTKVPESTWQFSGNYVAAIDMMSLEDWTFSDNTFKNVKGVSGGGRAAVFIWVGSTRVVVERNVMVGCDRGVAFGNPYNGNPSILHVTDSICRNNFIVPGPDAGIELAWVDNVRIFNNTVWRRDPAGRGIRCIQNITNALLTNNLVRGQIMLETTGVMLTANLTGALDGYVADPATGNLHLLPLAVGAIGKGVPVAEVTEDIDREARGEAPDIGADEFAGSS